MGGAREGEGGAGGECEVGEGGGRREVVAVTGLGRAEGGVSMEVGGLGGCGVGAGRAAACLARRERRSAPRLGRVGSSETC